ncbi:MAG: hypothetical protein WAT79_10605 [Saprospiraceae bacterium]
MWILSFNFALWPVVFAVYGGLNNLKPETVFSIRQLNLSFHLRNLYIWLPIIWERSKENGFRLSISNSILSVVTMEFIINGGSCNLCASSNKQWCAPGIGGIFAALESNGQSLKDNYAAFIFIFILIGITGIIVNLNFIETLDLVYKKFLSRK